MFTALEHLEELNREVADTKRTINSLCRRMGLQPQFEEAVPERVSAAKHLRPDQFFGKPPAAVVRECIVCGPRPLFGTFVNGVLSVVSLDDDADTCVSVGWRGSCNGVSVGGSFESEILATGPFTLGLCADAPDDAHIQADPALRR